jgi:hypothetical protein
VYLRVDLDIQRPVTLINPYTGEESAMVRLYDRYDITGRQKKVLTNREVAIHKQLEKFRKSESTFEAARKSDSAVEVWVVNPGQNEGDCCCQGWKSSGMGAPTAT